MAGLIDIRDMSKRHYKRGLLSRAQGGVLAVDRVSFSIEKGSVFGLVGESGCGKTTLARALLYLDPPTSGEVLFDGTRLSGLSRRELREKRRRMQIVFQDPNSALDPKMRMRDSMEEGLRNLHVPKLERERRVRELLELVGIPSEHASRYPHEFSGGQKQRIVVARALTMDPEFLVLDEPVSNLDVSIQAQIVNLLLDLKQELSLTYLFISHDLHLVATTSEIMARPAHPYTLKLFASVPGVAEGAEGALGAEGADSPPGKDSPAARGCPYFASCARGDLACTLVEPRLIDIGGGHMVACIKEIASEDADLAQSDQGGKR
jgi:oligopeptide transport system ATP-binding protein